MGGRGRWLLKEQGGEGRAPSQNRQLCPCSPVSSVWTVSSSSSGLSLKTSYRITNSWSLWGWKRHLEIMHCPCSNRVRQSWLPRTVSRQVLNIPKDIQRIYKLPGQLVSQTLLHNYPLVPSRLPKHNFLCHFPYCTKVQGCLQPISPYISTHIHQQRLVTSYLEIEVSVSCSKKTFGTTKYIHATWKHAETPLWPHYIAAQFRLKAQEQGQPDLLQGHLHRPGMREPTQLGGWTGCCQQHQQSL